MTKKIEVVEARQMAGGRHEYVVEVNEYDEDGNWLIQHSRTPFDFGPETKEADALAQMKAIMHESYIAEPETPKTLKHLKHLVGKEL